MASMTWTGERFNGRDLLLQNYANRAEVTDDSGNPIGEVLHLFDGKFQPRVPGIRGEDCASAVEAMHKVVQMHRRFRAR